MALPSQDHKVAHPELSLSVAHSEEQLLAGKLMISQSVFSRTLTRPLCKLQMLLAQFKKDVLEQDHTISSIRA
jgi:hypothetical protein